MSRWLATEGNVEAQINANKNKLEKCFDTVVLDNQDLTLRLYQQPRRSCSRAGLRTPRGNTRRYPA